MDRLTRGGFDILLLAVSTAIAAGAWFVVPERQSFEILFLAVIASAFAVLPQRRALIQATYVVILGGAIAAHSAVDAGDGSGRELARWAVLTGTVIVVGFVLQRMAASLHRRTVVAEAVAELGQQALRATEPDDLLERALRVAVDLMDTDYGTALRRLPDGRVRVAAELGPDAMTAGTILELAKSGSYALHILNSGQPLASSDLRRDPRITAPGPLLDRGVVSGIAAPVPGADGSLGVLAVHSRRRRTFTNAEVAVVQTLANVVATAWEQAANREQLHHQSLHDPLTGLPNRGLFLDRLKQALVRRERWDARSMDNVTVMLLDLDGFKSVNDTYGHAAGDEVLRAVAQRFSAAIRPEDTVARFGGDEFAVLCGQVPDETMAITLGQRILNAAAAPLATPWATVTIGASLGITMVEWSARRDVTIEALLAEADAALYRAKERGRGRLEVFNEDVKAQAQAQLDLETELQHAIDNGELTLHYQPIRSTSDQHLLGVEALVRWNHPERGMLSPDHFLPLAERTGLIVPLGEWVLRTACDEIANWQRREPRPPGEAVHVAVNVSARQLEDPSLPEQIRSIIGEAAIVDGTLMLELTETALLDGGDEALSALTQLRAAGAQLSLDDFGTGYSSLVHLARFPISALKIDRSFIAGLGHDHKSAAIVSAVIALGNQLDVNVIAEGVETSHQLQTLRRMNCYAVQGFLLDQPHPLPPM